MSYLTRPDAWTSWPWELLAIASWYSGEKAAAKKAHEEAKRIEPENDIVKANDRWFC
jgi:hypothetical protein